MVEDIILFDNYLTIDEELIRRKNLLPKGKKLSKQGFNYLKYDNVYNILELALLKNPTHKQLKSFVERFDIGIAIHDED